MSKKVEKQFEEKYENSAKFTEFIESTFKSIASNATLEEMAIWSFGSLKECLEEWEESEE